MPRPNRFAQSLSGAALGAAFDELQEREIPLVSSAIESVKYDSINEILTVSFQDGSIYEYAGVDTYTYARLANASSPGTVFNSLIRPSFYGSRVG